MCRPTQGRALETEVSEWGGGGTVDRVTPTEQTTTEGALYMSILKVFGSKADAAYIRTHARLIEAYDAFLLVEADEKQAQALAGQYPIEDITDQYQLTVNKRRADRVKSRA